jgi:hypothetical protein
VYNQNESRAGHDKDIYLRDGKRIINESAEKLRAYICSTEE